MAPVLEPVTSGLAEPPERSRVEAAEPAERHQELGTSQYVHRIQLDGAHLVHEPTELGATGWPPARVGPRRGQALGRYRQAPRLFVGKLHETTHGDAA